MTTFYRTVLMAAACLMMTGNVVAEEAQNHKAPQQQPGDITEHNSQTLWEELESNDDFHTLTQAFEQLDMADMLDGSGPYTIFAPTDEAFEHLPDAQREALLSGENDEWLKKVLKYHMLPGTVPGEEFQTLERPQALSGQLTLDRQDGAWHINDIPVEKREIRTKNGIIHPIDGVMMPWDTTGLKPAT